MMLSHSLVIRKTQNKILMRFSFNFMSLEKLKSLIHLLFRNTWAKRWGSKRKCCCWSVAWYSHIRSPTPYKLEILPQDVHFRDSLVHMYRKGMHKICCSHTTENYKAVKRNEVAQSIQIYKMVLRILYFFSFIDV